MKTQKQEIHYLVFDCTSYYVTDYNGTNDEDIEIINKGFDIDVLQNEADLLNEGVY